MERDRKARHRRDRSARRSTRPARRRSPRRRGPLLLALLAAAVLIALAVAPAGQAVNAERQAERQAQRDADRAEREAVRHQKQGERDAQREAVRAKREAHRLANQESTHAKISISCTSVSIEYRAFAEEAETWAIESIVIKTKPLTRVSLPVDPFFVRGAKGTSTVPIAAPQGPSQIVVRAKWLSGGSIGGFGAHEKLTCGAAGGFAMTTTQSIAGSGKPLSTETLEGHVGQTVDYQTTLTNNGNTPLHVTAFSDPTCDAKSIAGPGNAAIAPGAQTQIICSHALSAADASAGSVVSTAKATLTPGSGEGSPITHESSALTVAPIGPEQAAGGGGTTTTTTNTTTNSGSGGKPAVGKSGVASFTAQTIPALVGPRQCVRGPFVVRLKSKGVSSVTFYLDGHKLRTMTQRNARAGLLSLKIDARRLKAGTHKLIARITMSPVSATAKAAKASRSLRIVRCH